MASTDAEFLDFLKLASEEVAKWPEWKRNLLGRRQPVRDPVPNGAIVAQSAAICEECKLEEERHSLAMASIRDCTREIQEACQHPNAKSCTSDYYPEHNRTFCPDCRKVWH